MSIKKNSFVLFITKISRSFLELFTMMILSRYLILEYYGHYREFLVSLQIISVIVPLGISASIIYFLSSKENKRYLPNIYIALFIISFILFALSPIITKIFDLNFKTTFFQENLLKFSIIYMCSIFATVAQNMFIALGKVKFIPIYMLVPNTFWLFGIFYSVLSHKSLDFIFTLFLIRFVLYTVITIALTFEKFEFKDINLKRMKSIFLFGLPVGVSNIIGLINTNIDKLIIGNFYDSETFAVFANGAYEMPFLSIIGGSLFNILIPTMKKHFDNNRKEELIRLWIKAGNVMITIMVPIAVSLLIFSKPLVILLFSEKYIKSVPYFALYQVKLLGRIYLYGSLFLAVGKSRLYMYNATITMTLNLILDIIFVKLFGPIGAVIATVVSTYVLVILQIFQISKILNTTIKKIYPWKEWIKAISIVFTIDFAIFYVYSIFSDSSLIGFVLFGISLILSFGILNKLINDEILKYILRIFGKFK